MVWSRPSSGTLSGNLSINNFYMRLLSISGAFLRMTDSKPVARKLSAVGGNIVTIDSKGFSTNDGYLWLIEKSDTGVNQPVTVSSKLFTSFITKAGSVILKEGSPLKIESGKLKASLPVLPNPEANPDLSSLSELVTLDSKTLFDLMGFCSQVTNEQETYDFTSGIRLSGEEGVLEATATDKLRVAVASITFSGQPFDIFIPSRVVKILKLLDSGSVKISETPSLIVLESGPTTVAVTKLTKKLPDVQRVFPKSYCVVTTIKIKELQDALHRISPALDPETQKIIMTFDGDVLKLSVTGEGQAEDEISIETSDPFSLIKIAANNKFLLWALTSYAGCGILQLSLNEQGPYLLESGQQKKLLIAGMKL